jgi:hypothetical protein
MEAKSSKFRRGAGEYTARIVAAVDAIRVPMLWAKRLLVMINDIFEDGSDFG